MESLTKKQAQVVKWLVENDHDDEPTIAVREGLVSHAGFFKWGGSKAVAEWCKEYRRSLPPPPLTDDEISRRLRLLAPKALSMLEKTIENGYGDKTAVGLSQWIIKETVKPVQVEQPVSHDEAERELAKVLRLVK
jgi:hypothetical protein